VQAVTHEAAIRQFTINSGRRAGRPPPTLWAPIWLRTCFWCSCAVTTRPAESR
jgi:hypothetical protein